MRAFVFGLVLFVNFLIETTLLGKIALLGVTPVTVMIIVVSYAILRGDVEGAILGFFAGILWDIFFMDYLGLYALIFSVIGFFCGKPFKDFFPENYILPVLLTFFAMILFQCSIYFVNFSLQGRLFDYFQRIIIPETIYTLLLTIPIYRLIYGINSKIEAFEKKRKSLF